MHRCSESVGSIATALAKAQTELTNPEKSMVGTIYLNNRGDNPQTFRYAPLSGGLEIVRKVLGGQQIAVAQTTDVDRVNGLINLTTVLMHTSGEWISSDWPVCALSEASAPRRMGAALTYARRYALFTLVGIAGEDDLDAPELPTLNPDGTAPPADGPGPDQANGHGAVRGPSSDGAARRKPGAALVKPMLKASASGAAREQLLAEMAGLAVVEELERWAFRCLPIKNTLTAADARLVEEAFQAKLAAVATENPVAIEEVPGTPASNQIGLPNRAPRKQRSDETILGRIDKSLLAIPEPRRLRDKDHLKFVAKQPCLICGRQPCDAHHLRFAQSRGLSLKVSDEFTVPLCRGHHRELHRSSIEADWWKKVGVDATAVARKLWNEAHPIPAPASMEEAIVSPAAITAVEKDGLDPPPRKAQKTQNTKRTQIPSLPT